MAIFEGAGVALVTPFTESGEVNYEKLEALLEEQIAGGTDAIIACGTTGESATMSYEEHLDVIRFTCKVVNKRIPVIAGTGSNCTREAIHLSKEAEKAGADGLLLVTPYYNKATQNGLIAHYTAIAESVNIPCLLYHVPTRTGLTMKPETIVKLCREVPNIVGVKEASGNFSAISEIMHLANGCVDLYSGNDDQIVPLLALGGKGVISVVSNVAPELVHNCCQAFFDGDTAKARDLQLEMLPLSDALFCEVNPIPIKYAMNLLGWEAGECRLPLVEPSEAHQAQIENTLRAAGLIQE